MSLDVTDADFQTAVLDRSNQIPVVVDLWAPWCGPCRTLGPIIEKVIDATGGQVELVKVNIDENPGIAQAFGVQSIPLVVALKDGQPIDGFLGAQPEHMVKEFVDRLLPSAELLQVQELLDAGDEESLNKILAEDPGHTEAVVKLADLMVTDGRNQEALDLLARIPETDEVRQIAARARLSTSLVDNYDTQLVALLNLVKDDEAARQQYLDILEVMGPDDERTAGYRRKLTNRLF
jgi:putative thioredoxin